MSGLRGAAALGAAVFAAGCFAHDYASKPRVAVVDGDPIVQMSPPGKLPSLLEPRFAPIEDHDDPPFPDEKVVGVTLGPRPRMYPLGLLDTYEVVDAGGGGVPYVVARCPLADLVAVFDRRVAGRTLTFENSGALWRDMLVLRDRETGTYWTPATGRALEGPLAGETLAGIPAPLTTTAAWEGVEPGSVCLRTGDLPAVSLTMKLYASSGWEGVSGIKTKDHRFPPKERVFFVAEKSGALAFTAAQIRERKRVESRLDGRAITIEWDAALGAPRAYRQTADAREEAPVLPIYWFALTRHFAVVDVWGEAVPAAAGEPRGAARPSPTRAVSSGTPQKSP